MHMRTAAHPDPRTCDGTVLLPREGHARVAQHAQVCIVREQLGGQLSAVPVQVVAIQQVLQRCSCTALQQDAQQSKGVRCARVLAAGKRIEVALLTCESRLGSSTGKPAA